MIAAKSVTISVAIVTTISVMIITMLSVTTRTARSRHALPERAVRTGRGVVGLVVTALGVVVLVVAVSALVTAGVTVQTATA